MHSACSKNQFQVVGLGKLDRRYEKASKINKISGEILHCDYMDKHTYGRKSTIR